MTPARDIYAIQTGRESHVKCQENGELPCAAYVEWLERIVERTAVMVGVAKGEQSVWDADDVEDLVNLF